MIFPRKTRHLKPWYKNELYAIITLVRGMIKKYRKIHNLTQEKLAELLDISPRQLQRIESGQSETSLKTLKKLIKILDISDEDIVEYIKK
mgnify:CR=1 FL=1